MAEQITAQQRAQLFAMSTRQNLQMLAKQTANTGASTLQFNLPKARLLAKTIVHFKGKVNVKHASKTTIPTTDFTIYKAIRRISLDLNNGFSPFVCTGEELALYNMLDKNGSIMNVASNYRNVGATGTFTASTTGKDNDVDFYLELPVTINPRDPIGLILLQNSETNVDLTVDTCNGIEMFDDTDVTGYTVELKNVEVSVCCETFSIPSNTNAYPDLSVIKLVNGRTDALASAGQQVVKMSTGTIYRKIILYFEKADGTPMSNEEIGNIEIVFNQADVNYNISPDMLRAINTKDLGFELPKGVYIFDFSSGGNITNYGGTRDYIDTEKLTEFWIRTTTTATGSVKVVSECLARLH